MPNRYILLASNAGNFAPHIQNVVGEHGTPTQATFVTTAANPYEKKEWMEFDIQAFENNGISITRIDFAGLTEEKCIDVLNKTSTLVVGGGNPLYLLEILQQKNLISLISRRVTEGMDYIGSSAGAVIAAPNISLEIPFDNREHAADLYSYDGLHLTSVLVMPHWGKQNYKETYLEMLSDAYEQDTPILSLTDNQALEITTGYTRIISCV